METIPRSLNLPEKSFFLFGPRGTGKSTWVQQVFPEATRLDMLQPDIFRTYCARPEQLREVAADAKAGQTVVIDEVQRVPALLAMVHSLMEENKNLRFILTGSSARKLKRAGVDLLGGRAVMRSLHPFLASELGARFDFSKALSHGLLPLAWEAPDPDDVLKAYASLYLREEVQMEGLVRNIGDFSRFLETASFSHASELNFSNLARECQIERKTAEGYMGVLADLLLGFFLPVFTKRAKRATTSHPKFYYFDAGVYRSLRPRGPLDRVEEIEGHALEGLVAQHLRAWNAYGGESNTLSFWRTRSGSEVDFVVYGPDGLWALEVKNTGKIRESDLKTLKSFQDDYPEAKCLFLYRGQERLKKGNILCVSVEEFLLQLKPGRLLDAEV
jgi:predicted AAA+ superfamily ATPase